MEKLNRTENLLVLILLSSLKGVTKEEKANQLNLAGFSNLEIANFLQTRPAVISQMLYLRKQKDRKEKRNV
ncbi:hypothetical protein A2110_01780 [Candidatus Jorgensenbacteria bacterium GWA1_54_12]|uniref:HTH luxR-type domain-containing protein n=1 Tax=Candidatus Jorgensenbacteria bacterium GWA1_54_12 TaxID=1798468 RepID=A0A1F6BLK0_9BACT|nr:MAG: hypothetical protein A2110_01780 [Candidatus Jorgensenbacteria bacterium GWA1_54_12]